MKLYMKPVAFSMAWARVNQVLNATGTELHMAFGPLFDLAANDAAKATARRVVTVKPGWSKDRLAEGHRDA